MTASGTITVLFTDLVASTGMFQRLGEDGAEQLRRSYFTLMRDAVSAGGGEIVKSTGDGLMIAFDSAYEAVASASAIQRAVARHNAGDSSEQLGVRIGMEIGDPVRADNDLFGMPVVTAARLCQRAEGGQILVSDLLRRLVDTRGGVKFRELGPLELKGIADPVDTWAVVWETMVDEPLPVPPLFLSEERGLFVGRSEEVGTLLANFDRARAGERRLVLVEGEAGIGKSRLAREFSLAAHRRGATVLLGHCTEGAVVPFQPFAEALRQYVETCPHTRMQRQVLAAGIELVLLIPELAERIQPASGMLGADPEGRRFRLFEAVAGLLTDASRPAPLVLILEDLHCAAEPTLRLLEHVARYRHQSQLLIIGTYRSTDVTRASALWRSLPDLRDEGVMDLVKLTGLGHSEVTTLIEVWAGGEVAPDLPQLVQSRTEGNPFFIGEVLRGVSPAVETGDGRDALVRKEAIEQAGIPKGVKELIGRRLDQLAEPVVRSLSIASVIGRRFRLDLLERVSDRSGDELADWLEQAVEAQVVFEVPGAIGLYNFSHTLIAETLYEDLTATRRARLHRQTGEAIEAAAADDLQPHLPELAHHFLRAGPAGEAGKAVAYLTAAAERALEQLAYEQAATQLERALEALDQLDGDPRERCDVLLLTGRAHVMSGNPERAKTVLVEAAELARKLDDPESLARAALTYARPYPEAGIANETTLALLEEALGSLGPVDSSYRARALAQLAMELHWSERVERRFELSREAIEVARRIGDDHALGTALHCRHYAISGPDTVEERLAIATEMLAVAGRTDDKELALWSYHFHVSDSLELGDGDSVERGIRTQGELATELRYPFYLWVSSFLHSMWALLKGDLNEAEGLATEALVVAQSAEIGEAVHNYGVQIFIIRREQGRLGELEPIVRNFVQERGEGIPGWQAALAYLYGEMGDEAEARKLFDILAHDRFSKLPRDITWLMSMGLLADTCAFLEEAEHAPLLYQALIPYRHRNVVVGTALSCTGAVSRPLGRLAATLGDWDSAERHFEDAVAMNERVGTPLWTAYAKRDYADMLIARDRLGDQDRAQRLLDEAHGVGQALGLDNLVRTAERSLAGGRA
jgi:class 3 adenylate cyclase/tetratricopeptide (TPR) repeat protein